jgi:large subunit ribosomal protein L3
MKFFVGRKLNMSQHFDESGTVFPVTIVQFLPGVVTQVKNSESKDKYSAVQVGVGPSAKLGTGKRKKISQALAGHLKGLGNYGILAEFRVSDVKDFQRGQKLNLEGLQIGELVNVTGVSKGRGFAGAMKRHGFKGFPMSHGHNRPRSVGSIGQRFPQHTRKGLRMAGHMGNIGVTVKNLQVVEMNPAKNLICLKGAVPGHRNGIIKVMATGKIKPLVKVVAVKEEKKKK